MRMILKAVQFSDRSWGSVNKSKLPRSCYLIAKGDKKENWHLPYREGAGGINPKTGMYRSAGPVNKGALRAISGVLGGAREKKKFSIPVAVLARFKRLYKLAFGRAYGEKKTAKAAA